MADFDKYVPTLSKLEGYGVFTNNPYDAGGATMSGVTLSTFRAYFGSHKTVDDLKNMTYEQWHQIMKSGYWDKVGGGKIYNQSVAELIADFAVNCGPKTAVRQVQELLGETVDGIAGPMTLRAINTVPQEFLFNAIKAVREVYYRNLVDSDPGQAIFLKGWLNRIKRIHFTL